MEIEQVALITMNQTVKYESTRTAGRWFTGRVHLVDGVHAVIKHDTEPYYVTVACPRLTIVPPATRARFTGQGA